MLSELPSTHVANEICQKTTNHKSPSSTKKRKSSKHKSKSGTSPCKSVNKNNQSTNQNKPANQNNQQSANQSKNASQNSESDTTTSTFTKSIHLNPDALRWDSPCKDPMDEARRIQVYKDNRRLRYKNSNRLKVASLLSATDTK